MVNLNLRNIKKVYNQNTLAVDNVSFVAGQGQFVVLLGPSGCGKSSLLRMIAGLEDITSGELYFDDKLMNDVSPDKRNIGMVFQNYALYPHLTVYENIAFPLKVLKVKPVAIKSQVQSIAQLIGLDDLLKRKPKELSGGQRQRVALARALIRKPDLFLFDEPLSNLDAKLRVQMRSEIINIHKKAGTTSIYVTHDQTEAMTMGDLLVILNNGKLQQSGTPEHIYKYPTNIFVAGFIGSPQMNFFEGKIQHNNGLIFHFNNNSAHIELDGNISTNILDKDIIIGVRPEHLEIEKIESPNNIVINNIEFLGYENIIHFEGSSFSGTARVNSEHNLNLNNNLKLKSTSNLIHIFDLAGQRINL
ncbi:MAG TPA: ABC transporter ATP-binding protein [Candidatus Kapabacteria bacterium]|nr:ABC transporter ATP-binding protein [Candidatus Kapabacteria bacterium]